jgi:hypothetical protein
VRWLALALVGLTLTGCEATAEKSARLERQAKLVASHEQRAQQALSFTQASAFVRVLRTTLVRGSEGAAAVVTVRNASPRPLRAVPIAITVHDSAGRAVFRNDAAGTESALVSISSIPPRGEITWVDDQIPPNGSPATVTARVGEAPAVNGALPKVAVSGLHLIEDPTNGVGAAGTVSDRSRIVQHSLVVFVVALRGGRPVAAARAVVAEVATGTSVPFQAFFVGDPLGATLHADAPATTTG